MSNKLDMCLVDDSGIILLSVPVGVREHAELMSSVKAFGGCELLQKMEDYYEDAKYQPAEVRGLHDELQRLMNYVSMGSYSLKQMGVIQEFLGLLFVLKCLCAEAERKQLALETRAV